MDDGAFHVGLIPDGNRRWAAQAGMSRREGHEHGAETVEAVLEWAYDQPEIDEFSVYGLSEENFKRSGEELDWLFQIYQRKLADLLANPKVAERDVRIRIVSTCPDRWPREIRRLVAQVHEQSARRRGKRLNVLLGYTGQSELRQAVAKPRNRLKNLTGRLTDRDIERELLVPRACDLVIRTGYEEAPREAKSGFLLWQSAYAEFQHVPKHFPDLTRDDLDACWERFRQQQRRLGT
ncbi:MAG: polyprenyl diphosphate synthase [Candidatus Bipolaricaulia bacterium]